jgi:hypothetical protein
MKHLSAFVGAAAALSCVPAHAQQMTRAELTEALTKRDAVIAALQARVDALEQGQGQGQGKSTTPSSASAAALAPQVSATPTAPGQSAAADDEANVQALSETLLQRGGLVLAPWRLELIPSVAYSNRVVQGLTLVQTPEGIPTVADQRLRDDQIRGSLALRIGLPLSSQIEVQVPYNWIRRARALGDGTSAANTGSGIGDVEVALSHQFFQEKGRRPAVTGGVSWRFRTGQDPLRARVATVATGSGADEVRGRLTAIKSSDPLVFFGTLSFAHTLPTHQVFGAVQNGNAIGLQLGMVLALNPDTSMTFGVSQDFRGRTRLDGDPLPGTDTISSSLLVGIGRVLSPNLLLDVSLGVGLTRDSPDYVFQLSLPFRFH